MKVTFKDFIGVKPVKRTFESNTRIEKPRDLIKPQVLKEQIANPTPQPTSTPIPTSRTLVDRTLEHIKKLSVREQANSFEQPSPSLVPENLHDVVQKLKVLEAWLSKISALGPGGGAGDIINLDHSVKLVTGDYTLTRNDYYIGVNAAATVNITIPNSIASPGRRIIIKDESGRCSRYPIVVSGNVDNDPGGFILSVDNGAIQMIYRQGWRIV